MDVNPNEVLTSLVLNVSSLNELVNVHHLVPVRRIPPAHKYSEDFGSALKWPALKDTDKNDGRKKNEFPLAITSRARRQHYIEEEKKRKKLEKEKRQKITAHEEEGRKGKCTKR